MENQHTGAKRGKNGSSLVRDQEAGGSNPLAPTNLFDKLRAVAENAAHPDPPNTSVPMTRSQSRSLGARVLHDMRQKALALARGPKRRALKNVAERFSDPDRVSMRYDNPNGPPRS